MTIGEMVTGELPDSPPAIIYHQVRRVLSNLDEGKDFGEPMSGLMALMEPLKDNEYYEDLRQTNPKDKAQNTFWITFTAIIKLLARKHLWIEPPRSVEIGDEFAQGF